MPLLAYFAIVGPILLGLIVVSDVQLGPPKGLMISTVWNGLPTPHYSQRPVLPSRYDNHLPIPLPTDALAALASAQNPQAELSKQSNTPVTKALKVARKKEKTPLAGGYPFDGYAYGQSFDDRAFGRSGYFGRDW